MRRATDHRDARRPCGLQILDAARRAGLNPTLRYEVDSWRAGFALVGSGFGFTLATTGYQRIPIAGARFHPVKDAMPDVGFNLVHDPDRRLPPLLGSQSISQGHVSAQPWLNPGGTFWTLQVIDLATNAMSPVVQIELRTATLVRDHRSVFAISADGQKLLRIGVATG